MKLKICGMKYQDNIKQVAALQPHYLGFIFYEKSSRNFESKSIVKLPESIKKTGVFVNAKLDFILEKISSCNLQAIQLHGKETPGFCEELQRLSQSLGAQRIEIIKVFSIKNTFDFHVLEPYETVCDYYLFDTKGELPGGNGYTFNWDVLNNYSSTKPYFLSGGISLDHIEAIIKFKASKASKYCYAIDINSQFEIEPGLKNISILKEFKKKMSHLNYEL